MNELEFSFEPDPVDAFLSGLKAGDRVAASHLLTLLEGEDTETLENVLQELETAGVTLEIDLPKTHGTGEAAARLRQEELLAAEGLNPGLLEESDPLRLYLEELAGVPTFGDEAVLAAQCAEKAGWGRAAGKSGSFPGHRAGTGLCGLWRASDGFDSGGKPGSLAGHSVLL